MTYSNTCCMVVLTYREGLYWPDECILFWRILGSTLGGLEHKFGTLSTQQVTENKNTLNLGVSASAGTGIMISTLFAVERFLNWPLAFYKTSHIDKLSEIQNFTLIRYSTLLWECLSIWDSIQIRGLTWVLSLYDISSNSPSGGTKEMVLSFSNLDKRTHWWNLTSSSSTAFALVPENKVFYIQTYNAVQTKLHHSTYNLLPVFSNSTLSFSPSLSSGMPDSCTFILTAPTISLWSIWPVLLTYQEKQGRIILHLKMGTNYRVLSPHLKDS